MVETLANAIDYGFVCGMMALIANLQIPTAVELDRHRKLRDEKKILYQSGIIGTLFCRS